MDALTRGQKNKIRRMAEARAEPSEEGAGEINVVPFLDIITNVLMFVLATLAITFTATIESVPPRRSVRGADEPSLGLTILVVPEGFSLKARGGNVAEGCDAQGTGLAVPKTSRGYDYASLNACAAKLKSSAPQFASEHDVIVSANPQIPYDVVVATLDAVRTSKDGDPLFPDVRFGVFH